MTRVQFQPSLSAGQLRLRAMADRVSPLPFPCRIVDSHGSLVRAESLTLGGCGLLVMMNHFSMRDSLQVLSLVFRSQILRRRPILAPVAFHQYGPIIQFLADRTAIKLQPVVTRDTVARLGEEHQLGSGLADYVQAATQTFKEGGIVILAPQGGRRSHLGEPGGRPVGILLAQVERSQVDCLAFLFVGLGIPDETDYSRRNAGGLNVARSYQVRLSRTFTLDEVMSLAGGRKNVDSWAFSCLKELVPESYGAA